MKPTMKPTIKPTMKPTMKPTGFTLIEIAIVLFIMGVMAAAAASSSASSLARDSKAQAIADQMKTLSGAVNTLISSNFDPIVAGSPVAGFANPLAPTVPELVAKGYLANNFRNKNLAGTGFLVKVSKVPAGCVAPACDLAALTYPDAGFLKAGLPDLMLTAAVSDKLGNDGGTSLDATPATISGPNGSWTAANPLGAVQGVVALQTGFGAQGLSQFVRMGDSRSVTLNGGLTNNGALTNNGNASITGTTTSPTLSVGGTTITASTSTYGALTISGSKNGWSGINFKDAGSNLGTLMMRPEYSGFFNVTDSNWRSLVTENGETYTLPSGKNGLIVVGSACPSAGYKATDSSGMNVTCQGGVWVSNKSCSNSNSLDLNLLEGQPGSVQCYNGSAMPNAPTGDWYFVEVFRHTNPGNYYVVQTAHAMTGASLGSIYERVQQSGAPGAGWGAWVKQGGGGAVPSGSICGWREYNFHLATNQWGGSMVPCQGFDPGASCPAGYSRYASWSYGASHYNSITCVKI